VRINVGRVNGRFHGKVKPLVRFLFVVLSVLYPEISNEPTRDNYDDPNECD